jgi:hypothetical protein
MDRLRLKLVGSGYQVVRCDGGPSIDQQVGDTRATRFAISGGVVSTLRLPLLLGEVSSEAFGINDAGWIVGRSINGLGVARPFVFVPGTGVFEIEPGVVGDAFDINNNEIVGRIYPAGGGQQTVRWVPAGHGDRYRPSRRRHGDYGYGNFDVQCRAYPDSIVRVSARCGGVRTLHIPDLIQRVGEWATFVQRACKQSARR